MVFYFVQRGETLYAIARRYQTTVHAIVAANRLEDPNGICPGQALIIPRPGEVPSPPPGGIVHLVRQGETVFHLAKKFGTTPHEILRANQIAHPEFILPGQQLVIPERMEPGEDWPMLGRTPGRVGASPVMLLGPPTEGWSYAPRKNSGIRPSAPVVRYDRVFVGLGDGHFYSLDRGTGRVKWRIPAGAPEATLRLGEHELAAPAVFDGLAYLCCPDGTVLAVDAYTGQHIWKVATGGLISSPPAVADGIVYVGGWDEHLYALEAKTGAIAWKRHVGAPVLLPVAAGDDHVFVATEAGMIWAIEAQTGNVTWQVPSGGQGAPVFAEVVLLAGGMAFDPKNGQVLWQVDARGASPVARLDQVIYPGGTVDLFTGTLRRAWAHAEPSAAELTDSEGQHLVVVPPPELPVRVHIASGTLVLGVGADQRLYAWNAETGQLVWVIELGAHCCQPPGVAPGQAILAMADGSLRTYRFNAG
jgi:outer membrane protein assembly factor BamB